ncbi:hypothetical protein V5O48_001980 [Marasmius crinis-equi]|uniref:GST N-terminal domain-containing protein n=1 Tax=Marasmius crinis-equi TaxID=585013 RepID=A0ABR3FXC6_9AGAR
MTRPVPPIRFFDITSKLKTKAWSPNCWKIRYVLNYKNLPYETTWVEYPDIEPTCLQIGASPTSNSTPRYTLPVIQDESSSSGPGVVLSDSYKILQYLESQYPSTPEGALSLNPDPQRTRTFLSAFRKQLSALWAFAIPQEVGILTPRSEEYFRRTRQEIFGVRKLEELMPKGKEREVRWKKFEEDLGVVDSWVPRDGARVFVGGGGRPTYPDFVVSAIMIWCRTIWGEDSQEWRDISSWHGGRWGRLVEMLKEYETVK